MNAERDAELERQITHEQGQVSSIAVYAVGGFAGLLAAAAAGLVTFGLMALLGPHAIAISVLLFCGAVGTLATAGALVKRLRDPHSGAVAVGMGIASLGMLWWALFSLV